MRQVTEAVLRYRWRSEVHLDQSSVQGPTGAQYVDIQKGIRTPCGDEFNFPRYGFPLTQT